MAVIAFIKRNNQPKYKIKKVSQAIWVAPNGDATFNLECIFELIGLSSDSSLNEIIVIVDGDVPLKDVRGCPPINYQHGHIKLIVA